MMSCNSPKELDSASRNLFNFAAIIRNFQIPESEREPTNAFSIHINNPFFV
jgi:hypothetical protein